MLNKIIKSPALLRFITLAAALMLALSLMAQAGAASAQYIGEAQAKTTALSHAGLTEAQTTYLRAHLDRDDGHMVYDVEFYAGSIEYEYEIEAVTGAIWSYDREIEHARGTGTSSSPAASAASYIGEAKAKSVALTHAGLTEAQVVFLKAYLDYDDGRVVYDMEFYADNSEYDYEIDAVSGDIWSYDRDIEYYTVPTAGSGSSTVQASGNYIGEVAARAAALSHAGVTEAQAVFIKAHPDYERGRVVYDVEFYAGNTEYDYEIDATTGDIVEYDREIEYYSIPTASASSGSAAQASGAYIGEAKAQTLALAAAGLSASQVRRIEVDFDRERGVMVYEVDFKSGYMEYEYEIDAVSGAILKSDIEYDD